jgi:hypothetical protein
LSLPSVRVLILCLMSMLVNGKGRATQGLGSGLQQQTSRVLVLSKCPSKPCPHHTSSKKMAQEKQGFEVMLLETFTSK